MDTLNHAKTQKLRISLMRFDIHHVRVSNGDHKRYAYMNDGRYYEIEGKSLRFVGNWRYRTSDPKTPIMVDFNKDPPI